MAQRLGSGRGKAHALELDVRSYPSFERAVTEAVKRCGRIDYLFNNAGIDIVGEIDSYTLDDWNNVFDVNLRGVVHGIQAVYPIMIGQHSGHIVNTASLGGSARHPRTPPTPQRSTPSLVCRKPCGSRPSVTA
jgi:NADP-dependent 3-hydroxy acid dehydrogenase YdfG